MIGHNTLIRYEHGTDEWAVHPDSQTAPIFKRLSPGWYLYWRDEIEDYDRCPVDGPFDSFAEAQRWRLHRRALGLHRRNAGSAA